MAGLHFEELPVGFVVRHSLTRTLTEADNVFFCSLTMNPQPLFLDHEFAASTVHGRPLVNGILTLGLVTGIAAHDLTVGTALAGLGMEEISYPNPVFHGDTIRAETEVIAARLSRSNPEAGIVTYEHRGFNQRNELVLRCHASQLVRRWPNGSANGGN